MKPTFGPSAKAAVRSHAHPATRTFINVGIVLAIITAIEFGTYYATGFGALMVAALAILSAVKFILVAAYFMHLRFDPRILSAIFAVGVTLATLITVAVKFISLV